MLEKLVGGALISGSLFLSSGCVSFKPYDVAKIETVVPVVQQDHIEKESFNDVSWEEAIKIVETPEQVMVYCRWLFYEKRERGGLLIYSFKDVHNGAPVVCIGAVYSCAALLSDNGYPPLLLGLSNNNPAEGGHCVYIYKIPKGFGSGGLNQFDWVPAQYTSVNDLAREIANRLVKDGGHAYKYYDVYNLNECDPDFITRSLPRFHVFSCTKRITE